LGTLLALPSLENQTQEAIMAATKKHRSAKKRELIDTGRDKRYVRRDDGGRFAEVDDQGRSLSQDRRRRARTTTRTGQGDKGDRRSK
jgi:hypothetical protein